MKTRIRKITYESGYTNYEVQVRRMFMWEHVGYYYSLNQAEGKIQEMLNVKESNNVVKVEVVG
jgi:hypothetical protein